MKKSNLFLILFLLIGLFMGNGVMVSAEENKTTPPDSVTGEKINGDGTVVDYSYGNKKEFYTITTEDGKVYYMIIDYNKETDNVYFLREINETDLNIDKNGTPDQNTNLPSENKPDSNNSTDTEPDYFESLFNNSGIYLFFGIMIVGTAFGYYFKIVKPKKTKKDKKKNNDDEEDEFEFIE